MVFPLLIPIAIGGAVFTSAYALQKLYSEKECERQFEGSCNKECDYFTGDAETCYYCLGTCGVPAEDYAYYLEMLNPYEKVEEQPHEYVGGYPVDFDYDRDRDRDDDDRDDHDKYKVGRRNRDKWEGKGRDKKRGKGRSMLQDRLDRMSGKHTREHVGGGHADMTQDTRGYFGIIIS